MGRPRQDVGKGQTCRPTFRCSTPAEATDARPRDVFIYFIHEGKLRAPAAAIALIERL